MANILGVDYYRVVSETGEKEWSQVYVKMAFDKDELDHFGTIFGIVKTSGKGDLVAKGMSLIGEIEDWCKEPTHRGDVAGLLGILTKMLATGAFVWIYLDDSGARRMKAGALNGNAIALSRDGQRVWLFEYGDGRVVTGELKDEDKLFFGSREAVDLIDKEKLENENLEVVSEKVTAEMMKLPEGARAALILTIKPMVATASEIELVETTFEEKSKERKEEKLVGDRVVGIRGWKDFMTNWRGVGRLRNEDSIQKRHKWFLLVGAIFLAVLGISVGLGLIKAKKNREEATFKSVYEPLEKKRMEAEALFDMNPVGARELLRSVKQEVSNKKGQFDKTPYESKMVDLSGKIDQSWTKVSGEQMSNLDLFFDLGLVRSSMKGDRMGFDGKQLVVLDSNSGIVAKVSYPDKKQEVILGKGEGQEWIDVAGVGENGVLLTKKMLTGFLAGKKSDSAFDAAVTDPVAIDVFPGAAYVLDPGASEIWRFGLSGGQVNDRRRWFVPGVEIDIHGGVDLAIDVDVWVGLSNGKIMRFRRGQVERFGLSDIPDGFGIKRLAVSNDSKQIAVLDSDKGRIVLFNKETGAYVKQIMASDLGLATDLVWVSDHELMILSGSKLYMTGI